MVKINITIEGDDLEDIIGELLDIGTEVLKSNRKEIRELLKLFSDEAIDVLMQRNTLERGAELYKKLNNEINFAYRKK